jgi:hypothetical protein
LQANAVTQHYAEQDQALAHRVMAEIGNAGGGLM